jgi:hypothetical protein
MAAPDSCLSLANRGLYGQSWPKGEWQLWNQPAEGAAVRTASASGRSRPDPAIYAATASDLVRQELAGFGLSVNRHTIRTPAKAR